VTVVYLLGAMMGGATLLALGVGAWSAVRAGKVDRAPRVCTLRHHTVPHLFAVLAVVFPGAVAVLFVFPTGHPAEGEKAGELFTFAALLGSTLLGAHLFVETWAFRVVVSDAAVTMYLAWRRPVTIPWAEVVEVSYSEADACLVLTGPDGREVRAPLYLDGAATLASAILDRLDPAVYAGAHAGFEALGARFRLRWDDTRWADRLRGGRADAIRPGGEASPIRPPLGEIREGEP
jgi:hypothetical protein